MTGDSHNISSAPAETAPSLIVGDEITVDFDSVCLKIIEKSITSATAVVITSGFVGSNNAFDVSREIETDLITQKDKFAIEIGRQMGVRHFALSFTNRRTDVERMRQLCGKEVTIISKIESP